MKQAIWVLACFLSIVACANAKQDMGKFIATLPNGITVELIGVSYHGLGTGPSEPKRWWKPDGSDLPDEPYRRPHRYSSSSANYYVREFAIRVTGAENYSSAAFSSLGRSNTQPGIPKDGKGDPLPGLRSFICKFENSRDEGIIRIGISIEPWQKVEEWEHAWYRFEPEDIVIDSEKSLIFTWPRREKRGAIILEITHRYIDEATRLLMFDRDGNIHEKVGEVHGEGVGLAKHLYWYWNIKLEDMQRLEFQKRLYQWIEFHNVSLEPGRKTNVQVVTLPARAKEAQETSSNGKNEESLGYILDKLNSNLSFPSKGRAIYEIEERLGKDDEGRVLRCEYVFHGSRYKYDIETVRLGSSTLLGPFNIKEFFDGEKTTLWYPQERKADIREGRKIIPIYKLDRFSPFEIMEKLLNHNVQVKGSDSIDGIPCLLLECVISAKEKIKVWVTNDPDIYLLRIERYEFDNLRYLYQAENIEYWNQVLFPEKITSEWYRSDDAGELSLVSSKVMRMKSFMPNIEIAPKEFKAQFPPGTSVAKYTPYQPQTAAFAPGLLGKRLPKFKGLKLEIKPEQVKDKLVLVCFWDMNQRPSRNCLKKLAERANELAEKGVAVVAVQTLKVDENKLNDWVKKYKIPFAFGMIQSDEEKTKFNWGVKSLPWLILSDQQHIVRSEGFGIDELDERTTTLREE